MLIQVPKSSVRITDHPYNADPTGRRLATQAIQNAVWDASDIEIPPGRYRIGRRETIRVTASRPEHVGIIVPSDRRIWGHEGVSVLLNEVDDPTADLSEAWDNGRDNVISWFWTDWDARNITYEGLTFGGQGPTGLHPGIAHVNLAMSCIDAAYEHWESRDGQVVRTHRGPEDVRIRRCHFERQFGFWAHARGGGRGWVVEQCTATDCMNGLNLNVEDASYLYNTSRRSEGFECSGSGAYFTGNRFEDALVIALAFGGHAGDPTPENTSRGARILGTIVERAYRYGIQVTANTSDTLVADSYVTRCRNYGIFAGDFGRVDTQPRNVRFQSNDVIDCGGPEERAAFALLNVRGAMMMGNRARFGRFEGYEQAFGLLVSGGHDIEIADDNDLDGRSAAVFAHNGTRGLRLAPDRRFRRHHIDSSVIRMDGGRR